MSVINKNIELRGSKGTKNASTLFDSGASYSLISFIIVTLTLQLSFSTDLLAAFCTPGANYSINGASAGICGSANRVMAMGDCISGEVIDDCNGGFTFGCVTDAANDAVLFYKFTAPAGGTVEITVNPMADVLMFDDDCNTPALAGTTLDDNCGSGTYTISGMTPGVVYIFQVREVAGSYTVTVDNIINGAPDCTQRPNCTNGIMDCEETGVDCGGPDCPPCGGTCSDGIQNQDEEAVDCGGVCAMCGTCGTGNAINSGTLAFCCGTFYDGAGPGGNYTTDIWSVGYKIGNGTAGNIKVCFSAISLNPSMCSGDYDEIRIYNNANTLVFIYDMPTGATCGAGATCTGSLPDLCVTVNDGSGYAYIKFIKWCAGSSYAGWAATYKTVSGTGANLCISSTCVDGLLNGSELAIDCGGTCAACAACPAATAGNAYGVYAGDGAATVTSTEFLSINDGTGTVCNVCTPTNDAVGSTAISGYDVITSDNYNCTGVNIDFSTTDASPHSWNFGAGATPATSTTSPQLDVTYSSTGRKDIVYDAITYNGFVNITMAAPSAGSVLGTATGCPGTFNYASSEAGSPGFAYLWTVNTVGGETPSIATNIASSTNITFSNNSAGNKVYTVTLTVSTECCGQLIPINYAVTIYPIPANPAATATPASVCVGGTSVLNVTGPIAGYNYGWYTVATGGSSFATGTSATINPVLSGATTYYIDAVSDKGCPAAARGSVVVTGTNTPPTVPDPASECAPGIITATVSAPVPGATYNWYSDVGLTILLQSSTSTSYGINVPGPGPNSVTVYVTVIEPGCGASTSDLTIASITGSPASATWDGSTSTDWFVADNWTPSCVPNSDVDAVIANTAVRECSIDFDLGGIASVKSITIESSRTLTMVANKAILDVYGNWANSGAFVPNTGLVAFKGTSAQVVSGSVTTFYNLTNDNGSAAVTLNVNISVSGTLHLADGVIGLNGNTITSTAGSFTSISRDCGYLLSENQNAKVNWNNTPGSTAATYVFPFGYGGNYIPFKFAKDAADPATDIAVSTWNTSVDNNSNLPTGTSCVPAEGTLYFVDRWWSVTPNPVCTAEVTFFFTDAEKNTIADPSLTEPVSYHWNPSLPNDWDEITATYSNNSVTSTWKSFSGGGGGGKGGGIPLPVTTLYFNAVYNDEKEDVDISWATLSEINNDYFTVERSRDGKNFEKVTIVDGAGNSNEKRNYATIDPDPWYGISYYRLKQTDFDGKFTFSEIVPVNIARTYNFSIQPNPARDEINVAFNNTERTDVRIDVFNTRGKIILSEKFLSSKGGNEITLDLRSCHSGMFFLRLTSDWDVYHEKFVKE